MIILYVHVMGSWWNEQKLIFVQGYCAFILFWPYGSHRFNTPVKKSLCHVVLYTNLFHLIPNMPYRSLMWFNIFLLLLARVIVRFSLPQQPSFSSGGHTVFLVCDIQDIFLIGWGEINLLTTTTTTRHHCIVGKWCFIAYYFYFAYFEAPFLPYTIFLQRDVIIKLIKKIASLSPHHLQILAMRIRTPDSFHPLLGTH